MSSKALLIEIGSEDLPANNLENISLQLLSHIDRNMKRNNLIFKSIKNYYTCRRLIFLVDDLQEKITLKESEIKGPRCDSVEDSPRAVEGFAKKYDVSLKELKKKDYDGIEYFIYKRPSTSINSIDLIPNILIESLKDFKSQKMMKWGSKSFSFVRPIKWILIIYRDQAISSNIYNTKTTNYSFGHRAKSNNKIEIKSVDDYFIKIKKSGVLIDQKERRDLINKVISKKIQESNFDLSVPSNYIDKLNNIVEFPNAFLGKFPKEFLKLPEIILTEVLKNTQDYLPLYKNNKITNSFIGISNVEINSSIIFGNERVVVPRLSDADFFLKKDLDIDFARSEEELKGVIFHRKLGSISDKVNRINLLVKIIDSKLNIKDYDRKSVLTSVPFIKIDLLTNLVNEMPNLQGYAGAILLENKGYDKNIFKTVEEHYLPRFSGDKLPSTIEGSIVSLADKLDTISGIFVAKEEPTGTRDPFAVRRSTLGILRIIIESKFELSLSSLFKESLGIHKKNPSEEEFEKLYAYVLDKLKILLCSNYNFQEALVNSVFRTVLSRQSLEEESFDSPYIIYKRVIAVEKILTLKETPETLQCAKRIGNIIKSSKISIGKFDKELLKEKSEQILYNEFINIEIDLKQKLTTDYIVFFERLGYLNRYINKFFDEVMINVEDQDIKNNRLSLLHMINYYYTCLADFSLINLTQKN
ncbi:MAG: glycine--tRNA ligase subunit beta [Gammaproteobacteria bacterium]|nr:glycine--tRNA ligase subunit beta [Gammaproteobacteria bacterium]